jgi:DNA/RNA-binding domain of Phe-tRNA-synthetase-like protein
VIDFRYSEEILARFPTIRGGLLVARGLCSGATTLALSEAFRREQAAVLERLHGKSLADVESLAAWRRAFRAFGVDPTQYRSAAEALLRRLTKKGEIPAVNLLVDIGNMVSIRYALPVAVIDARGVSGEITVQFARGDEPFVELDADEVRHPEPGEVIFVDRAGDVCARRWCWRQSARSAARESTQDALVTVEAHHAGAEADVRAALADLSALFGEYAGGARESFLLPA